MSPIFIFHGIQGHPGENWFPWLKKELEKNGHHVIVPAFPHPDKPLLQEWMAFMDQHQDDIGPDSIFVGHSLGGAFALRMLESMNQQIKATFLVASVSGIMGNQFDPLVTTFNQLPYDWDVIRKNTGYIEVIHSDNDPYITTSSAENLAGHLHAKTTIIPDGGHFNEKAGYLQFPLLLEKIQHQV